MTNKNGLGRSLTAKTKQLVRERCGFGCVICGKFPYHYDHFHNEFKDVEEHNPDDIVLLCHEHHGLKTASVISAPRIEEAMKSRSGVDAEARFKLPLTIEGFQVSWAGFVTSIVKQAVVLGGTNILQFDFTENDLEPVQISGEFTTIEGHSICRIEKNEIIVINRNISDMIPVANRFRFNGKNGKKALSFSLTERSLNIDYILQSHRGAFIYGKKDILLVGNSETAYRFHGGFSVDADIAIEIAARDPHYQPTLHQLRKREAAEFHNVGSAKAARAGIYLG